MPLVVEHTIYSIVNVLRPAVRTNQNNFAQLLCNQFSCCMHYNLSTPVPSHSITTVTCKSHTGTNSTACATVVFTFSDILCDNTLRASCARIATCHFFDPASPGSSAALAASPAVISVFIQHFGQSRFICPNSLHAKHLILLASRCYNCHYGYGSPCTPASLSIVSTIFLRSIGASQSYLQNLKCLHHQYIFSRTHGSVWLLA